MSSPEYDIFAEGRFSKTDEEIRLKMGAQVAALREAYHPEDVVAHIEDYNRRHSAWLRHYRGKIPATWDSAHAIAEDIRRARGEGVTLSSNLVEAILTHPLAYPLQHLSSGQRLTAEQLAFVIARPDLPHYVRDYVSVSQRLLGQSHELWREAGRIAKARGQRQIPYLRTQSGASINPS